MAKLEFYLYFPPILNKELEFYLVGAYIPIEKMITEKKKYPGAILENGATLEGGALFP